MSSDGVGVAPDGARETPAWAAVVSLSLGVFGLVTAEFLPASLLTPMAATLGVSEGVAGQAVTVTAMVALAAGLLAAPATRGIDRRLVLMAFSVLLIGSNLLVAFAPNLGLLLLGRVMLGVALGGFWSMAAAMAMRLVPQEMVPRALSMIFSGVSLATIVAAPLGSYLGGMYGWRSVFLLAAAIGVVGLLAQFATLPPLAPTGTAKLRTLAMVLGRRGVALGMLCTVLVFGGHFALFTYIRPMLELTAGVDIERMALILLGFGVANLFGTFLAGFLLQRSLRLTLIAMPVLIGSSALVLAHLQVGLPLQAAVVALWGMAFGAVPVGWSTWVARTVPDEAESAGGLIVAAVQLAIASGAALGGLIFEMRGVAGVFGAGGVLLLLAAILLVPRVGRDLPTEGHAGQHPAVL
ncbi:MFS transporter [Roseomonas aerophila]|uniref:MFS transporter n=1 Tax=Teichococcus aerophilus TaxID=1224513 RepID=A0ABR7RIN8_9PROT|nr:MFS transporter [Pseudoroseomonas aerophila]MBC9206176.1 MFS transporter [Pseudoroseomonas aerophila]